MKRTPLKRGSGLRRVSVKRRAALPAYSAAKAALPDKCEAQIEGVCTGMYIAPHHWFPRGRGGPLLPGPTQILYNLCQPCHTFCHDHAPWARENGWLKP